MLLPELPGILNWALDGLRAYWKVGLSPPAAVSAATDEYRKDMDIVGRWIEERCLLDKNAEATSYVLYQDYKAWADAEIGFYKKKIGFGRLIGKPRGHTKTGSGRGKSLSEQGHGSTLCKEISPSM